MKRVMILILAVTALGLTGCGKKKSSAAATAPPAVCSRDCDNPDAPGGGGGGGPTEYGSDSETELDITALSTFRQFFSVSQPYNPQNIRIGMAVGDEGSGGYGGDVWISYDENGRTNSAVLSTYHPNYTGVSDSSKNVWFTWNGNQVWHGFFQDRYGAVVVVIDDALNLGDGSPAELIGGEVWFQNFEYYMGYGPQGPLKMCWQINLGPYDCRTFIVGSGSSAYVDTYSALYPNNSDIGNTSNDRPLYKKLGEFYGMPRAAAMEN